MKFSRPLAMTIAVVLVALPLAAQTCSTASDMDPGTKAALERAGQQFFTMASHGDTAGMRQNAIGNLASNFGAVETAVRDNTPIYNGAQATLRGVYLLDSSTAQQRGEFFCGIFNSPDRVGFAIPNLPAGQWAVVIEDLKGGKTPGTMSLVLQQEGGVWKLAGFFTKSDLIAGHDGNWFVTQARQYKSRGESHNAWLYYLTARELLAPVAFMSTPQLDQLYDESQSVKPTDIPPAAPLILMANGKTYNITQLFAVPIAEGLDLVAKYQAASISDTAQTYADNTALIKALVAKFPEFRQAFAGVVVRAMGPGGSDYGTLLAMKDVK